MKSFNIKIDLFYGRNCRRPQLSLSKPESGDLPSLPLKKRKKRKMKYGTQM